MNNDYWKKYLEQRKQAEELHEEKEEPIVEEPIVEEPVIEEVHKAEVKEELHEEKIAGPVEGQVRNNGLHIFRNGKWTKRFPNH